MILELVQEAIAAGARQGCACEILGIDPTTIQAWRRDDIGDDRRRGLKRPPRNKLTEEGARRSSRP